MSQTIANLPDEPFQTLRVRLEDQDYTLELRYNTRAQNYSLSIFDAEDVLLVAGLKVFPGVNLLDAYKYKPAIPRGSLQAVSTTEDLTPPKLGELGADRRVRLTYFTAQEFLEIITELAQGV